MVDQRKAASVTRSPLTASVARNFIVRGAEKSDTGLNCSYSSGNVGLTPALTGRDRLAIIGDWQRFARRPRLANDCPCVESSFSPSPYSFIHA
jgi:hypothetical protein